MRPDAAIQQHGNQDVQQPGERHYVADTLLTQRDAADLLKVSVSYLRSSSCPKVLLPGNGPRRKPLVRYLRSDVLSWALSRRT